MDLHDFRTHALQDDICNRWSFTAKHGTWADMLSFLRAACWLAQNPYSTFLGPGRVRQLTINNLLFLQSIAEQRLIMNRTLGE